ncbi:MAG: NAD-dependent epimerase/dehydratase family protein [Rhodospirillaceae bacterium]|nr:NAD-dependent epimerase/dehydratase family protein [Rhodospirillaceae bacterium]MBT5245545.1 NAD-dependent epimerase/dehydratase family protein [Rhodospirillaceae bacterium]MBT5561027.1 NAD-dependent epimerase/dehydratase family protein [Rhodospirillaceae bacterium]MBT6240663.1 NAD-dependent epimerase/dehydratase family protein [Rhodospirillaceae bacterium]
MASRILFIGGTRFFGKRILANLIAHGHDVTMLTRGEQPAPDEFGHLDHILCDRKDSSAFENALDGRDFDAVIDNVCYQPADAEQAVKVLSGRCQRYIFTSSVMCELNIDGHDERLSQYQPGELDYARNKQACEEIFLNATGFKSIVFRLQNVVGEDDFSGKSGLLTHHLLGSGGNLRLVGDKDDLYQQIYAGDLETIYNLAVDLPAEKTARRYTIGAAPIAVSDYVAILADALALNVELEWINKSDGAALPVGVPYPMNVAFDCSALAQDFNFAFSDYAKFLPRIAQWYKADHS